MKMSALLIASALLCTNVSFGKELTSEGNVSFNIKNLETSANSPKIIVSCSYLKGLFALGSATIGQLQFNVPPKFPNEPRKRSYKCHLRFEANGLEGALPSYAIKVQPNDFNLEQKNSTVELNINSAKLHQLSKSKFNVELTYTLTVDGTGKKFNYTVPLQSSSSHP